MAGTSFSEAVAKLRLDLSEVSGGKAHLEDFAKKGHAWFEHVGSAGRSFHKVLHQITEQIPLLGIGITAMKDVTVAALNGALVTFTLVHEKLQEWNKEMDEAEKSAAEPIGLTRRETQKLGDEHERSRAALKSWLRELSEIHHEAAKALERELKLNEQVMESEKRRIEIKKNRRMAEVQLGVSTGAILPGEAQKRLAEIERESELEKRKTERAKLEKEVHGIQASKASVEKSLSTHKSMLEPANEAYLQAGDRVKNAETTVERLEKLAADADKEMFARESKAEKARQTLAPGQDPRVVAYQGQELRKDIAEYEKWKAIARERHDILDKENKKLTEFNKQQAELKESLESLKGKVKEWSDESQNFADKLESAKNALTQFDKTPIGPGQAPAPTGSPMSMPLDQLGKYNTPYGAVAREIELAQRYAQEAAASGRFDLAGNLLKYIHGGKRTPEDIARERQEMQKRFDEYRADPSKGLMSLLPPGLTTEQVQQQQLKDILDALKSDLGVVIKDIKDNGASTSGKK